MQSLQSSFLRPADAFKFARGQSPPHGDACNRPKNSLWRILRNVAQREHLVNFGQALRLAAIVAMLSPSTVFASAPASTQAGEAGKCDRPVLTALVIDDQVNVSSWVVEHARQFRLPMPAAQFRKELELNACVTILDSDPVFASVAGAAQPDAILRVRLANLKASEKTLGEKAGTAVGRYIGSYLGNSSDDVPVLKSVEINADLLCARSRRVTRQFGSQASSSESAKAEDNVLTLNDAIAQAVRDVNQFLLERPTPCEPSR